MKSIEKAVSALRLMVDLGGELRVADVSRHLKVNRSTASRLLASLASGGLIEQDPVSQRYGAGMLAVELAANFHRRFDVVEQAQKEMDSLAREIGHTVWLGVLSGTEVVVLKTARGSQPIQFAVEPGHRLPAHAAAMGKALLALKLDAEIRDLFKDALPAATRQTVSTLARLQSEIVQTRLRGYGISDQELFEGVKAISIALESPHGSPIAVSVSYPLFTIENGNDQQIVEALLSFGRRFGARIGDVRWTR